MKLIVFVLLLLAGCCHHQPPVLIAHSETGCEILDPDTNTVYVFTEAGTIWKRPNWNR